MGWLGELFKLLWNDDVFLIGLKNTIIFSVVTGPISYIACFVFAWLINELNPKVRAFMTLIFLRLQSRATCFYLADYFLRGFLRHYERFSDENRHSL